MMFFLATIIVDAVCVIVPIHVELPILLRSCKSPWSIFHYHPGRKTKRFLGHLINIDQRFPSNTARGGLKYV